MLKKIINIFLILTLAVQMLPIRQMGAAIFNNVFTEEIPHSVDFSKDIKKNTTQSDFFNPQLHLVPVSSLLNHTYFAVIKENLPQNFSSDILVPPPNNSFL